METELPHGLQTEHLPQPAGPRGTEGSQGGLPQDTVAEGEKSLNHFTNEKSQGPQRSSDWCAGAPPQPPHFTELLDKGKLGIKPLRGTWAPQPQEHIHTPPFFLIFIFERQRQSVNGGGADRGRHRTKAGSRLRAVGKEPDVGLELTNREIMTRAEVRRSELNGLSPPGAPVLSNSRERKEKTETGGCAIQQQSEGRGQEPPSHSICLHP